MWIELILGILIAVLLICYSSKWHARKQLKLWSNSLIIATLVYIGFGCYQGAWNALPQEVLGVLGYGTFAYLGYRYSPLLLASGWLLHILWDMLLHAPSSIAPQWYPGACLGFDIMIGAYILYLTCKKSDELQTKSASSN